MRPYEAHIGTWMRHWFQQACVWVRQTVCGLHGHDALLHVEHDRMYLECSSCGYQTPGWHIDVRLKTAPTARRGRRLAA